MRKQTQHSFTKKFENTRVGYTEPVGKPMFDVISLYSRVVNSIVLGQ